MRRNDIIDKKELSENVPFIFIKFSDMKDKRENTIMIKP